MRSFITKYINLFLSSDLVKISWSNSKQVLVRFIIGIVNIKIISLWLGASGMAIFTQVSNFIQIGTNIANGGINHGVTKLSSQYKFSILRQRLVLSNALFITIFFSLIVSALIFLSASRICNILLIDKSFTTIIRSSGFFIFCYSFTNVILAFIQGIENYKKYINYNLFISIVSFLVLIILTYLYQLKGAVWALYISSFLCLCYGVILSVRWFFTDHKFSLSRKIILRLLGFGLTLLVASSITPILKIIIRNIIIDNCSLIEAGWWDGVKRISDAYVNLIITTLSLYFLPRISSIRNFRCLKTEIFKSIKIIFPFLVIGSGMIFIFKDILIEILFTHEFRGMKNLFSFQCIGDVIRVLNWFFAITIMFKEKIKTYIFLELFIGVVSVINAVIFIPILGIKGSTFIYFLNTLIYFIALNLVYRWLMYKESMKC